MAKLGQIKSGTMRVGNTTASGYGIVYADEIIGHRRVNTYADLANIPDWSLYNKAGGETTSAAIGQLWYVTTGDTSGHSAGLYQLTAWSNGTKTWTFFKNGANASNTTYTFANGSNGTFTVTPSGGSAQTVSIGKPATAGTADHAKTADSATKADSATSATNATNAGHATSADSATSATKATQDKNGHDIVDTYLTKTTASSTYATKSDVSALSSALVYKGTIGTDGTITTTDVPAKVGDVYVAVAGAPAVNGVALEAGDMIIAKTAGDGTNTQPTWTAVQTNINGAVTSTGALADNTLILGNNNRAIKASSGNGFVKVINGGVSYNNDVVTTSDTLDASKLIIGKGKKNIQTASGTGFVKISNGVVLADNSTYLTSVPKATTTAVGGGKVVNVFNETAAITNTDPEASNVTLYGLQIDKDGNFYTPVKNAAEYSLPVAGIGKLGGIELGYKETGKNYAVKLDGNKAYVSVPWTDTNTTYPLASTSANGLMSATDKKKLDNIQNPTAITTAQLDLCGYTDVTSLINAVAGQKDGLSYFVTDQNAIVTLQTDNANHAIIQTIRTATELNSSWDFAITNTMQSHKDGALFTYQRFYPIGGTYSTDTRNKWTKWAIIDVDTMYTANRSDINSVYKQLGKQLLSNLSVDTNGKITFSSTYSGTSAAGIKSQSKDILTPISESEITTLFN